MLAFIIKMHSINLLEFNFPLDYNKKHKKENLNRSQNVWKKVILF